MEYKIQTSLFGGSGFLYRSESGQKDTKYFRAYPGYRADALVIVLKKLGFTSFSTDTKDVSKIAYKLIKYLGKKRGPSHMSTEEVEKFKDMNIEEIYNHFLIKIIAWNC